MLAEVTDPQRGVVDHLAFLKFLVAQDCAQKRTLAGTVAADETDFDVVNDRDFGTVEQDLVTESFVSVSDLYQYGHFGGCNQCTSEELLDRPGTS